MEKDNKKNQATKSKSPAGNSKKDDDDGLAALKAVTADELNKKIPVEEKREVNSKDRKDSNDIKDLDKDSKEGSSSGNFVKNLFNSKKS